MSTEEHEEKTTLQRLVGLGQKLTTMDDATLAQYIVACQDYCLQAGEPQRLDPDQDPHNVDDPTSDYPSFNEWEGQRLLDAAQQELERRRHGRVIRITEIAE
jgi:hypothetical protein